jgi:putative membrane protein
VSDSLDTRSAGEESEPDYRFTLANERTYLAWIRTALALVAGAVAIDQFLLGDRPAALRLILAFFCLGFAAVLAVSALIRWRSVQAAMRRGAPLPRSRLADIVLLGVLVLAATAVALVAW